ncbi:MAG TPA: lysophospholipid acyltransferase family protein [Gemmataceae bacterium]|nr:lysophospholipid acyltransferase family protein [Gemmataceae bacterium]
MIPGQDEQRTMGPLTVSGVAFLVLLARWWQAGRPIIIDYLGMGVVYLYARIWHRWSTRGQRLPASGPAILLSNHTCSADPAFLQAGCPRPLSFVIAREYYHLPLLQGLLSYIGCVPVARNGRDATGVRLALRRLAEGRMLCIFPEGGLSQAGRRGLRPGKAGVALLALRSRAPVYPALIVGGPQTSSLVRAWLLPSRVQVIYGPPVNLSEYYDRPIDRKLLEEVTQTVMQRVASLVEPCRQPTPCKVAG